MSRRLRRLLSGSVAAAVVLALPTSYAAVEASEGTAGSDGSISVEGYVAGWGGGAKAYLSDRRVVDLIGVDGVELRREADSITKVMDPAKKTLRVAHRHRDRAELLLSNYSSAIDDFDPAEWSAHTAKGTVWWSDHRSDNRRVALAEDLGLHGVAVWQLASADPLRG